ncbi:MAG: aminopeptidase P family protein [Deltaproteobacteria bacterium]|nr:aminopeptidase P family protein [Deltaproteobacteria bacterium]
MDSGQNREGQGDIVFRREKLDQASAIMNELDLDLWLTFVRESETTKDPSLDVLVGANVTWQSAFMVTRQGRRVAIVGSLDKTRIERSGTFPEVRGYVGGISSELLSMLGELDPARIALNYSLDTELADGLTHGMYLLLQNILKGTPYGERFVSSERLVAALRGRKTPSEVDRIRRACQATVAIFGELTERLKVGLTEKQVAAIITERMESRGLEPAWEAIQCPAVFTGPGSAGAHAGPTDTPIESGHIMNVDFGVKVDGYCSDLQRTWYFRRKGEDKAPKEVQRGFDTIRDAVHKAADALRPGKMGWEIDAIARSHIVEAGYEEYPHALGHQVGRVAHDGRALLCPHWERYGDRGDQPIEEGQVYTIEPRLTVPGFGIATIEEIVWVRSDGVEFLSDPQMELIEVG